ncbi:endothelin-converting enzyme 1-like [Ptychodera flava]|uniref:endothelin-converting enzyme 1-like n=1 Tax=Ptychodera flava TaxID=63121 RepID=UPI00396AAF61
MEMEDQTGEGNSAKDQSEIVVETVDPANKGNEVGQKDASHRSRDRCCLGVGVVVMLTVVAIIVGVLCGFFFNRESEANVTETCTSKACVEAAARIMAGMDETIDPCQDFYRYACGGWLTRNPIPDDKSAYGIVDIIADRNNLLMKSIMEKSPDSVASQAEKKSLYLYRSCMDTETRDKNGVTLMVDIINSLGGWNPATVDLGNTLSELLKNHFLSTLISLNVNIDIYDSNRYILKVDEPQVTLRDRSFHLRDRSDELIVLYLNFMRVALTELGLEEPQLTELIDTIWDFEVEIAKIIVPAYDRKDTLELYNNVTVKDLQEILPQLDWLATLKSVVGSPFITTENEEIVLFSTEYLRNLSSLLENSDQRTVHNFMLWRFVATNIEFTTIKMHQEHAKVFTALMGTPTASELWYDCYELTSGLLGMAVGAMYSREAFDSESKHKVSDIIKRIKAAFKENSLDNIDWMSEDTRQVAIEKVDAIREKVGYPDFILDPVKLDKKYEEYEVDPSNCLKSVTNLRKAAFNNMIYKIPKHVDKNEWIATPQTVNAYYSPTRNDIVMLAAILQEPVFNSQYLTALNYGGIGNIIGHELTHGFDTEGRLYNKHGNIAPWWSEESTNNFEERAKCVVDLYSDYEVKEINMKVNGGFTQAENIADMGAVKHSYNAYKSLVKEYGEEPVLPGLGKTNDQLFFIALGQTWCKNRRQQNSKIQLISDNHSPEPFRVIGTVSQYEEFSRIFNCSAGSPMNPVHKCTVF